MSADGKSFLYLCLLMPTVFLHNASVPCQLTELRYFTAESKKPGNIFIFKHASELVMHH